MIKINVKSKILIMVLLLLLINIQYGDCEKPVIEDNTNMISQDRSDKPWPMLCHDTRHTGRSPYAIEDNPGLIKWKFHTSWDNQGSAVIDSNDIIYFGSEREDFFALYPNGTLFWRKQIEGIPDSSPAIDSQGRIYVLDTSWSSLAYLYSFHANSSLRWKLKITGESSITIDPDDNLLLVDENGTLYKVSSEGNILWTKQLSNEVFNKLSSTPAIADDGIIYCGSQNGTLYAVYPNGTIKWSYTTEKEDWIRKAVSIADDGTIYCGADSLYAFNPNGTVKWKTNRFTWTTPIIAKDGTVFIGNNDLYALDPEDGSVKWSFNPNGEIYAATSQCNPVISDDNYIVFVSDSGWVYALSTDGSMVWNLKLPRKNNYSSVYFSPVIGRDGTIYIGGNGYFFAIGIGRYDAFAHGPYTHLINEPVNFQGSARNGTPPYEYHWDFGDGTQAFTQNPVHSYPVGDEYEVTLIVTDKHGNETSDTTLAIIYDENTPPGKPKVFGPSFGSVDNNYVFATISFDREKQPVEFMFDWDDGNTSEWIGPVDSGKEIKTNYTWNKKGDYEIRVKAKDKIGAVSEWSEPFVISLPKNHKSMILFFEYFLQWIDERYPLIDLILDPYRI